MARSSAIACATASRNWAENSQHSYGMPLPETITMRFTEEDAGYVTVTPSLHFEVSQRIKEEFENGRDYYALHGRMISAPEKIIHHPDPAALMCHNEHCFKG